MYSKCISFLNFIFIVDTITDLPAPTDPCSLATTTLLSVSMGYIGLARKFGLCLEDDSSSALLSLASFRTILLDFIVTVVISVCIFKKYLPKLVNFCAAILILKMEEDMQHFLLLCFIISKTGKNATEMKKKRFVR